MAYTSALLGALPNWCAAPGVSIVAGSETTGTPAANLLMSSDDDLGALWRSAGLSPVSDTFLAVDLGQPRPVTSCYLVRHAHRPGDMWRLRGASAPIATAPRLAPMAAVGMAGSVSGDVAAVVEPVDEPKPDAITLDGPARLRLTFPAASAPLAGGPASQLLRLRVRARDADTAPMGWAVAVEVAPAQGPLPPVVEEIGAGDLRTSGETVLDLPFDSALAPAGSLVVELESSGAGPLELLAAEWRPETLLDAAPVDSGWSPLVLAPELALRHWEVGTVSAEQLRQTAALHTITEGRPVEQTYQHWRIDLRAPHHPRGHVQAAALALGPAMALDATAEIRTRIVDHSVTVRGADGTAYTRIGPTHTEATVPADFRSSEGPRELLALRRFVGAGGRFGVSLLPEEPAAPALSFWGMLTPTGGLDHQGGQRDDDDRGYYWSDTLELAEV